MEMEMIFAGLGIVLALVLVFVVGRWFSNWYFKINARLHEQQKTNELLQNIYTALVQGNQVNAVTANQVMNLTADTSAAVAEQ